MLRRGIPEGLTYIWNIEKPSEGSDKTKPITSPRNMTVALKLPEGEGGQQCGVEDNGCFGRGCGNTHLKGVIIYI